MTFQAKFTDDTLISFFDTGDITSDQVTSFAESVGVKTQSVTKRMNKLPQFSKVGRGKWNLSIVEAKEIQEQVTRQVRKAIENLAPAKDPNYVPFGNFSDVKKVIQSKLFYPTFITGLSGNGKTLSVEQACAQLGRELIRVNITIETDEDDLIGGFRLVDGNTVWHNGPVIEALRRGAILLLDEIDLASNKILCLQSILEGKGVFLKKIGEYVQPKDGFNIIATANTKGKGSEDGRFIGTNVLNEAFLERFPVTFEQNYPTPVVETKILLNAGCEQEFADNLIKWAGVIRKTFYDGGVDEVITTRRLVHIVQAKEIFGDRLKAITNCIARFDDDTKESFLDLYTKVDAGEETEYTEEDKQDNNEV